MSTYEVLVIGAGPAGLNAALALCRSAAKTVIFDSNEYRNSISKHMHTVPTWDHKDSREFRAAAREEILTRYKTASFVDQRVTSVKKNADGLFEAVTADGNQYLGHKVLLTTGVKDIYPDIPGYDECWGRAIFHCLFCHGYEERGGKRAGFLAIDNYANPQFALPISGLARRLADQVTIYTNGDTVFATSIESEAAALGYKVDARRIKRFEKLEGETGNLIIHFEDGSSDQLAFLAHTPKTEQRAPFAEQLGLELLPSGDVKTNAPFNTTNVDGVFAAGDCGGPMKSVGVALTNGMLAAVGALHQIVMNK